MTKLLAAFVVAVVALGALPSIPTHAATHERLVKSVFFPAPESRGLSDSRDAIPSAGRIQRSSSIQAGCNTWDDCWEVRNIREDGRPWFFLESADGGPGGTLSMSVTHEYQNGFTGKFGLSASFFSAEFGFSVTASRTVSSTYSYNIPRGTCARIKAYVVYQDYKGDLWHHPAFDSWRYKDWVRTWKYDGIGYRVFKVAC